MFKPTSAFSGFTVDDLESAKKFYTETLGLEVDDQVGGMKIQLPGDNAIWAYPKKDYVAPSYTLLNFVVDNIDEAIDELAERGVKFERYPDGPPQDKKGVLRGLSYKMGPDIAWFKDPAGNILSVMQTAK